MPLVLEHYFINHLFYVKLKKLFQSVIAIFHMATPGIPSDVKFLHCYFFSPSQYGSFISLVGNLQPIHIWQGVILRRIITDSSDWNGEARKAAPRKDQSMYLIGSPTKFQAKNPPLEKLTNNIIKINEKENKRSLG